MTFYPDLCPLTVTIVWETYEVIDKTLKSANFLGFMMTFNTLIEAGDCSWQHIDFDEDPFNALGSPITELSIGRPKEGHPREELYSIVLQLKENSSLYPGVHHPLTWGVVRQTSEFVLAIGWDSVQVRVYRTVNIANRLLIVSSFSF